MRSYGLFLARPGPAAFVSGRGRLAGVAVAVTLAAGVVPSTPPARAAAARSFRMFSLGYKQSFEHAATYETYRASLEARFEQIKPLLSRDRPNLVLFPEALSLTALLIGQRGAQGRQPGNTELSSLGSLLGTYAPQIAYYQQKCGPIPNARAAVLALTDTTWRAFGESLSHLARRYRVYVLATAFVGHPTRITDPDKVVLLGDPEVAGDYAYEATCDGAFNSAYVFGPSGRVFADDGSMPLGAPGAQVLGRVDKAYLTPGERNTIEGSPTAPGLSLSSPSPGQVVPVNLGFASLGIFTSKDAWMSDVTNRNDVAGADIFVLPEAGTWAGWDQAPVENWPQDNHQRSYWAIVQKLPSFRWGALTTLSGNFHDVPYDGTPTIVRDAPDFRVATRGRPNRWHFLLGSPVTDGIVARSNWFVPDPPADTAFGDLAARRAYLYEEGAKRVPGSGADEENAYVPNPLVWADVTLPSRPRPGRRAPAGAFAPSSGVAASEAPQWEPSLAIALDALPVVTWTDLREGDEDALVSHFDGTGWTAPANAGPATRRPDDQTDNQYGAAVATTPDGATHVAWLDFRNQSWDVHASSARDMSLQFETDVAVHHSETSAEGYPSENLQNDLVLDTTEAGEVIAAWDDARGTEVDRDIRVAVLRPGARWAGDTLASGDDAFDQFHPSVSATKDRVWIAWQDHRRGDADVRVATSQDVGVGFGPAIRADDAPRNLDTFHPQIAAVGARAVVVWSDDRSGRYQIRAAAGTRRRFGSSLAVAPGPGDQTYPSLAWVGGRRWVAAWTDRRGGDADIVLAPLVLTRNGLRARAPVRVDDDPGTAHQRVPTVAYGNGFVWVAWEDLRTGIEQVRAAWAPAAQLFAR